MRPRTVGQTWRGRRRLRCDVKKRRGEVREFESSKVEGEGDVSRGDAEAQRKQAAREAVRLELGEKRSTLNAQLSTLK